MDVAIRDTTALTMADGRTGILEDAAVGIEDGRIAFVGPTGEFDADPERTIDGSGRVTMPGLVDVHAHTGLTLVRGGAQDVREIEWMNRALSPLGDAMEPADRIAGARLGLLEALRSGVTTVGEFAANVEGLLESAYDPLGVRAVPAETINAVDADSTALEPDEPYPLDRERGERALERNEALFDAYDDHDRVHPCYGPQALDMVPPALLEEIRDRATDRGRDVHLHVAQGERERRQIEARYGEGVTSVDVLEDLGLDTECLIAAHLHGATPDERARLAEAGVRMAACPSSIAAIDGVVPPLVEYRDHGGVAGIGTDQAPGPGGHRFRRELRTAALLAKTDRADPTAFPAWEALRVGTVDGARALGVGDEVGTLEEGKRADVIAVDLEHPSVAPAVDRPLHTAIPNLVYGAGGDAVETVIVDGNVVVDEGRLTTADEGEIVDEAQTRAERVFDDAADGWLDAGSTLTDRVDEGWL